MTNLANLSQQEIADFLHSFDYVCFDVDGTLVLSTTPIQGSENCIKKLRNLGKKICFVTNNSVSTDKALKHNLNPFNATDDEITTPVKCLLEYLKNEKSHPKNVFYVGGHVLQNALIEAGFNIVSAQNKTLIHDIPALKESLTNLLQEYKNVEAVIIDYSVNFRFVEAQMAILLLRNNPSLPFLVSFSEDGGPIGENVVLLGNKFIVDDITKVSQKVPVTFAKPSESLKDYLRERCHIGDSKRVLFVGDSLSADIAFANKSGYQSLLVQSGYSKLKDLESCPQEDIRRPHFYADSLVDFAELLTKFETFQTPIPNFYC